MKGIVDIASYILFTQHSPIGYPANLQRANLRSANLQSASLRSANLQRANLRSANLQRANLRSANLQSANLQRANLQRANLQRANLWSANLQRANLQEADLQEADLQEADLQRANLQRANLQRANLWRANLWSANLQGAIYNPLMLLTMLHWGQVPDYLCTEMMNWDAATHPNPEAFSSWSQETGGCPYNNVSILRALHFCEYHTLYVPGPITMTPWQLWTVLCDIKEIKI